MNRFVLVIILLCLLIYTASAISAAKPTLLECLVFYKNAGDSELESTERFKHYALLLDTYAAMTLTRREYKMLSETINKLSSVRKYDTATALLIYPYCEDIVKTLISKKQ